MKKIDREKEKEIERELEKGNSEEEKEKFKNFTSLSLVICKIPLDRNVGIDYQAGLGSVTWTEPRKRKYARRHFHW